MVKQIFSPLSNEVKIYRAILRPKGWFDPDTGLIDAKAFKLRLERNPPEMKISAALSPEKAVSLIPSGKTYGVIEIQIKDIRSLGLNVVQDKPNHISITGIPCDEQSAQDYAVKLADVARLVI